MAADFPLQSIRFCCSYLLFCYFNGMPLNNFIKRFVWAAKNIQQKKPESMLN